MSQLERTLQSEDALPDATHWTDESPQIASPPALEVPVLLFAALKEAVGAERVLVRVPDVSSSEKATLDVLLACCARQYPTLEAWLPHVSVAVNCEYSQREQRVGADDEVALLPPVSGGVL
jgi:molybdopterin synthase catalytic subunit